MKQGRVGLLHIGTAHLAAQQKKTFKEMEERMCPDWYM